MLTLQLSRIDLIYYNCLAEVSSQKAPAWRPVRHYSAKLSTQVCRYTNWLQFKIFPGCNLKSSLSFADPQAALAESNLSFLHRSQSSTSQSPMDRASAFQHHHHHLHDGSLALSGHQSASKRVKMETPDEELSSGSMKAPAAPSEEYYCRNPAGGSSLVVVKQQQHETDGGGNHSSGTDNVKTTSHLILKPGEPSARPATTHRLQLHRTMTTKKRRTTVSPTRSQDALLSQSKWALRHRQDWWMPAQEPPDPIIWRKQFAALNKCIRLICSSESVARTTGI